MTTEHDGDEAEAYSKAFRLGMDAVSMQTPRVYRIEDMSPDWNAVHLSDTPGFRRGLYPRVHGSNFLGRLVVVPPGQRSPKHINSAEHIVLQLEGEAEFDFPDTPDQPPIRIRPHDVLFFPANIPYGYANVGDVDVLWFTILGRKDEWPPSQSFLGPDDPGPRTRG